jgi:amino acid transporter
MVLANTIGVGVFTTSGFALSDLRSADLVLLAWCLGGLHALAGALTYASLSSRFPASGGEYVYVRETLHPALGRLAGWVSLVAGFGLPIAAACSTAELYLARAIGTAVPAHVPALALLIVLSLLHGVAPRAGVVAQDIGSYAKALALAAFVGVGAFALCTQGDASRLPEEAATSASLSVASLFGSFVWITYAYSGWNAAVYVASEVVDARRTLRLALLGGTLLVTALYVAVNFVILRAAPASELLGAPDAGGVAARYLGGPSLERWLSALIAFALATCASSMIFSGARVYAKMAIDGALPSFFASRGRSLVFQCVACAAVVLIAGLEDVLGFATFALGVASSLSAIGLLRVLRREGLRAHVWTAIVATAFAITTLGITLVAAARHPLASSAALAVLCALSFYENRTVQT